MIRRPPRSTRTDTLFPYTTLFRSPTLVRVRRNGGGAVMDASHGRFSRHEARRVLSDEEWTSLAAAVAEARSEEHTSELQSLMRISYAVFCLKKKNKNRQKSSTQQHIHDHTTLHYSIQHRNSH